MGSLLAWIGTEESFGFSVSRTSKKENSLAGRSELSQLVKSKAGSLGCGNSFSGTCGEFKGCDFQSLRDIEESDIIGDGSNHSDNSTEFFITLCTGIFVFGEMFGNA